MTVYDLMKTLGDHTKVFIHISGKDITGDTPTSIRDIKLHYEERDEVLDSLELEAVTLDIRKMIIHCEK